MDQRPALAVGDADKAALKRTLRMCQPRKPPQRGQPLRGKLDSLADKLLPEARGGGAEVGACMRGASRKGAWQPVADLV